MKEGGGVAVLTRKDIVAREMEVVLNPLVELIIIEITINNEKLIIATVYMPPLTLAWSREEYERKAEDTIESLSNLLNIREIEGSEIILLGDFNSKVDWERWEPKGQTDLWNTKLLELISDHCLHQNVAENTRIRGSDNPTKLDLVFTANRDDIEDIEYISPLGKSDHVVLKIRYRLLHESMVEEKQCERKLNYKRGNYNDLRSYFENIKWETDLNIEDLDEQYAKFCDIYREGENKFVPKQKSVVKDNKKWFNDKCRKERTIKQLLWRRFRRHSTQAAYERYKVGRDKYTQVMREAKKDFEKDIISKCEDQPKLFYNYINSKTKSKTQIIAIKENETVFTKEKDMCEILNKKFKSVFTHDEHNDIEEGPTILRQSLEHITLKREDIMNLLLSLDKRKATGPDGISNWILKECAEQICEPLLIIFSNSLRQGKIPKLWKLANIAPLYKNGDRQNPLNYRPVSLTSVVCKLLEKIIRKQWVKFLEENNAITNKQFGFREGRSCVSNLLCFYDRVSDILQERDGWVDCIYLDLKKAFDKVSHTKLIWKLENTGGAKGKLLSWMKDFLQDRKMCTVIRGEHSEWEQVTSGVPQGSVLAPIMFIVFMNDLGTNISQESYINMFADDAKILRRITDENSCESLQKDIDTLNNWSNTWSMEFNSKKCHVVRFGDSKNRPIHPYRLGEEALDTSTREKDLGVIFNNKLTPEDHINDKANKMMNLIANMRRAFLFVDEDMVKKNHNSNHKTEPRICSGSLESPPKERHSKAGKSPKSSNKMGTITKGTGLRAKIGKNRSYYAGGKT